MEADLVCLHCAFLGDGAPHLGKVWLPSFWGCSSVGRALAWHARGQGFNSPQLHQMSLVTVVIRSYERPVMLARALTNV